MARRKASAEPAIPWGCERIELPDGTVALGRSRVTEFRALLDEIKKADTVTLSGERLDVVKNALECGLYEAEVITPRLLHAFTAKTPSVFRNRVLGLPDRAQGRRKSYPTAEIAEEYGALTGQGTGNTARYFWRRMCGLPAAACERHRDTPDASCVQCWGISLPLSRKDAVTAIQHIHRFGRWENAYDHLKKALRAVPQERWPRLPSNWVD